MPELTVTFDISRMARHLARCQTLGFHDASSIETNVQRLIRETDECFGLVLDSEATVMQVNSYSQAAKAGVQPGWSVRWIEVGHDSWLTSVPVSSRERVREIFKDCQRRGQSCVNVVFACEEPTGCPGVGIAYSNGCAGLSADTDYTIDDDSALRTIPVVTDIANANQSQSHDEQIATHAFFD